MKLDRLTNGLGILKEISSGITGLLVESQENV
ncbi:hypothetical protein SAMN05878443_0451 [Carnobacterium alterfunditum]|uniref:Uncharacterized protein n=1 Tax=Carnobacterium alterfunditum TaxID=28230 RepID=A0A1N6F7L6_9LACT|nr:hypothetical protein SAMN05878443_0451 [Carnobacterium alterfunditum]